jgi:hypothetical protein
MVLAKAPARNHCLCAVGCDWTNDMASRAHRWPLANERRQRHQALTCTHCGSPAVGDTLVDEKSQ